MSEYDDLRLENEFLDKMLATLPTATKGASSAAFAGIVDDWRECFESSKRLNASLMAADPKELREQLNAENALLDAFVKVLKDSPAPESALAKEMQARWLDLFAGELARNQELVSEMEAR